MMLAELRNLDWLRVGDEQRGRGDYFEARSPSYRKALACLRAANRL